MIQGYRVIKYMYTGIHGSGVQSTGIQRYSDTWDGYFTDSVKYPPLMVMSLNKVVGYRVLGYTNIL